MNLNSGYFPLIDRNHRRPVVVERLDSRTGSPGTLEDIVQHEHRHVAPNPVTLLGNLRDRLDHRLPEPRLKGVELEHIRPRREVGIPAKGKHLFSDLNEGRRIVLRIVGIPLNEVIGMIDDPGVVRRHVVGHKIEDEPHAALAEHASCGCKSRRAAEVFINDVAAHAVGRADIVRPPKNRGGLS